MVKGAKKKYELSVERMKNKYTSDRGSSREEGCTFLPS